MNQPNNAAIIAHFFLGSIEVLNSAPSHPSEFEKKQHCTLHLIMSAPGPATGDAGDEADDGAALQGENNNNTGDVLGYVPTNWDRQLPAATGSVEKAMEYTKTTAELRADATSFRQLLVTQQSDTRDINGNDSFFTALVSVPDSNKVKVIYRLVMGTAGIGHVSEVSGKLLALFDKGGGVLGPTQFVVLDAQLRVKMELLNLTSAEVATVFRLVNHTVKQQVARESNI